MFEAAVSEGRGLHVATPDEVRQFYELAGKGQDKSLSPGKRAQAMRDLIGLVQILKKHYLAKPELRSSLLKIDPKNQQTLALRMPSIDSASSSRRSLVEEFLMEAYDTKPLFERMAISELLRSYGLYKQACEGDCRVAEPGMFEVRRKMKWSAWRELRGMPRDAAMKRAVEHFRVMKQKYGS
eukprot:tig00021742_g23333.t1